MSRLLGKEVPLEKSIIERCSRVLHKNTTQTPPSHSFYTITNLKKKKKHIRTAYLGFYSISSWTPRLGEYIKT